MVEGKSTEELLVRSSMPAEVPKLVVQEEVEEGEVGKAVASRPGWWGRDDALPGTIGVYRRAGSA